MKAMPQPEILGLRLMQPLFQLGGRGDDICDDWTRASGWVWAESYFHTVVLLWMPIKVQYRGVEYDT